MNDWDSRSSEERSLFNPAFCSALIWKACYGYENHGQNPVPLNFELSFLILPFVLHATIRNNLPRDTRTSMVRWLNNHPLSRSKIANSANLLVPHIREAIVFSGTKGFLELKKEGLSANTSYRRKINSTFKNSSEEVQHCLNRAEFIGKWFRGTGDSKLIMTLLGIKP